MQRVTTVPFSGSPARSTKQEPTDSLKAVAFLRMCILKTAMSYTRLKDPKTESNLFESMRAQDIMPGQRLGVEGITRQKHCPLGSVE